MNNEGEEQPFRASQSPFKIKPEVHMEKEENGKAKREVGMDEPTLDQILGMPRDNLRQLLHTDARTHAIHGWSSKQQ